MQTLRHVLSVGGLSTLIAVLRSAYLNAETRHRSYQAWIAEYDTPTAADVVAMQSQVAKWTRRPRISIVLPVFDPPLEYLRGSIRSVQDQIYPDWELCIADDNSRSSEVRAFLKAVSNEDERIKIVLREENGHISRASNSALELATGEWVALLDHDDLLRPHSLFCVAAAIQKHDDVQMIYSDEDKIDEGNTRFDPYFKSDWDQTLFYGHNMFSHLGVFRRDLLTRIGGFRDGYEGAQDYDLVLRCIENVRPDQIIHVPQILYHWRVAKGSTAAGAGAKPYAISAAVRAINEHLERTEQGASVSEITSFGITRLHVELPPEPPEVSLIIPTRDNLETLRVCIDSIRKHTRYARYRIVIVDNGSKDPKTLRYLEQQRILPNTRVLDFQGGFNFAKINNFAVDQVSTDLVCLLNDDTEVIKPEWLGEMVSHVLRPGVGMVGALLTYPRGTIQHAGVVIGIGGVAGHVHAGKQPEAPSLFSRMNLGREVSAVTGACMLLKTSVYQSLGGMDETDLKVAFNDIDLCLRAREAGYRIVWTPEARLIHHESLSRGYEDTPEKQTRFKKEAGVMSKRWSHWIANDPAYNPNLELETNDGGLAFPPRVERPWDVSRKVQAERN